jgi:16S rRNA processing protein RimM
MGDQSSALIQLGFIGAPFGVRGWVKLRSHTDPPERLLDHRTLRIGHDGAWQNYRVEASGRSGGALTVKLTGIEDRDQAQALRGAQVCVPRSELPPADDRDYYRADLVGCAVVSLEGLELGIVEHFVETPAQVLMVVRGAREHWIPAVPQYLRQVDLTARRVVVNWDGTSIGDAAD